MRLGAGREGRGFAAGTRFATGGFMSKLKKRRESAREARSHKPRFRVMGGPKRHADAMPRSLVRRVGAALLRKALRRVEPVTDMVGLVSDHLSGFADQARAKVRTLLRRPAAT